MNIGFTTQTKEIIAPSSLAGRGLGVGFFISYTDPQPKLMTTDCEKEK
jgi:hypothetical protein